MSVSQPLSYSNVTSVNRHESVTSAVHSGRNRALRNQARRKQQE